MPDPVFDCIICTKSMIRFAEQHVKDLLAETSVSFVQWSFILMVGSSEGCSLKKICINYGTDKGQTTKAIHDLIVSGYAENRGTSRNYQLYLTDKGQLTFVLAKQILKDTADLFTADITPAEREEYLRISAKINQTLLKYYKY